MCNKCDQVDEKIAHYLRLRGQINDQQMIEAIDQLLAKLEAEKLALHAKE
jgi:hypothetical protein